MMERNYEIVRNQPVAMFYYKGTHSHPVRRTILVIEANSKFLRGYELREGSITRSFNQAPIKTFKKSKIAKQSQLGWNVHRQPGPNVTTLKRMKLLELIKIGL